MEFIVGGVYTGIILFIGFVMGQMSGNKKGPD